MSKLFKVIISTFLVGFLTLVFYGVYLASFETANNVKYQADKTLELQKHVEELKKEREEWKNQNPKLVQNLQEKSDFRIDGTPTVGMRLHQIKNICGQPDHSSYLTTVDGTINAYTYRDGGCKGVYGFDVEDRLVIINSY